MSSKTARVTAAAIGGRTVAGLRGTWGCSGECGRDGSGNDKDGNEDATDDGTFSQCGESDGSAAPAPAAAAGLDAAWPAEGEKRGG